VNSLNILAIIPARGGSKGIPKKNIRPFCGRPLIAYSIEAAEGSSNVSRVIVDTDSEEIAMVARKYGAEVPYLRPPELATDSAKLVDAAIHLLGKLKADENYEPTHVLLLQPTSPMRTTQDIDAAVALMQRRNARNVISVCRTESLLMNKSSDDKLIMLNPSIASSSRQEAGAYYKLDGCMIYLIETRLLLNERSFAAGEIYGYEIERWRAIDLDDPQDFVLGELVYENREAIATQIHQFN
jgi:CMP-N,N'-diacetyllegionaminic acid synthase